MTRERQTTQGRRTRASGSLRHGGRPPRRDPDDDILTLVRDALLLPLTLARDALLLPLALDRDALLLCRLPPPRPDLLQGTRWGLGLMGLVLGPTGIRRAPVEQDKGEDARVDSPSPGRGPSSSVLPWTTRDPSPTILLLLPPDHPHAGRRSAPGSGRTAAGHARYPPRPAGHRRVVTRRRLGEPPELARDGPH